MNKQILQNVNTLHNALTKQIERSEELHRNLTYNHCSHQATTIEGLKNCLVLLSDIANKIEAAFKKQEAEEKLRKQQADKEKAELTKDKE